MPETIVVYCSDKRYKKATEEFIKALKLQADKGLRPQTWSEFAISDMVGRFLVQMMLPKSIEELKEKLEKLHQKNPDVKRIVLIYHEGCRWFEEACSWFISLFLVTGTAPNIDFTVNSLVEAVNKLSQEGRITLQVYQARENEDRIIIDQVA